MSNNLRLLIATAFISISIGGGLYYYSTGSWKTRTYASQDEANSAAKAWIKTGGKYIVKLKRTQLIEVPRDQDIINQEIQDILEVEADERRACLKELETILEDKRENCLNKFFQNDPISSVPRTQLRKEDIIIQEERFRRECKPISSPRSGYVCGEHAIRDGSIIDERQERNLRANTNLYYFYSEQ